ncbi:Fic/DOC family protein [Trinickia symbiotica]|uniref:Fic family protein n=1 Tax=Trinickia symbiotica TaxID=863227 RepID=A0A2N7X774_9BURK|nr:Fic family protein [Trinickia symbiotica]PMS37450.1 Fic family protein [Trinickia symbiotica]PPK42896.1 Fic/DOC family protein [Trinickia symbiotica]
MSTGLLPAEDVIEALRRFTAQGHSHVTSSELANATGKSLATIKRLLDDLRAAGRVNRHGTGRATRYTLASDIPSAELALGTLSPTEMQWSPASVAVRRRLAAPLATRAPVSYKRDFVDHYEPNKSWLIPEPLAIQLANAGRMQGQQPAGTYARKVLEQLLIDLSWSSSRLEGNRFTLLDTRKLFESGIADGDFDAVMLLNHKSAIEFLVDAVPTEGLSTPVIRNLHAVLMQNLLVDEEGLGTIRKKVVNISDTTYLPMQVPSVLEEMLDLIVTKARLIRNPVEAAFFLWTNLAYLQPFEDGNKRTSRLAANIPLMLYNCAPLSFLDVDIHDYALAMIGVYELRDVSLAVDLFEWTYRRSIDKYKVVLESMGVPDTMRLRYRQALSEAIGLVVRGRKAAVEAASELGLTEESAPGFSAILADELAKLEVFNCARYRLTMAETKAWIEAGRPG